MAIKYWLLIGCVSMAMAQAQSASVYCSSPVPSATHTYDVCRSTANSKLNCRTWAFHARMLLSNHFFVAVPLCNSVTTIGESTATAGMLSRHCVPGNWREGICHLDADELVNHLWALLQYIRAVAHPRVIIVSQLLWFLEYEELQDKIA